ncbi:MAG TPA: hypothetical protein VNN17_04960, partial [Terriglobia bacterium]|nr:hypothetical protein [Terriglobia bacterium]
MARALSAAVQAALAAAPQRTCHLLEFTAGASTYRFTDGDGSGGGITHGGNLYLPHLRVVSGPRYSEELKRQSCVVRLQNITLTSAALVKDQQELLQGPEATLSRLFLAALEA